MDQSQPVRRTPEGLPVWIFSDGKAGHEAQCLGVAHALGVTPQIKRINPAAPFKWLAPFGPVAPSERFGQHGSRFAPPWPALALATGRATIPYIRALKRRAGPATFTVVLMDPRTGTATADLIWVPEHDELSGANVIRTLTSPHAFSQARLAALRASLPPRIAALPHPRVAVLIGGPNRSYVYTDDDIRQLSAALSRLAEGGASLMITPSRRTPAQLAAALRSLAEGRRAIYYDGTGDNPYPEFLAHADFFVVTADSVNMAGEAAATGRPIFIFTPHGNGGKFDRFHAALRAQGVTRPLAEALEAHQPWDYPRLDSARSIADEIERRWSLLRGARTPPSRHVDDSKQV